MLPLDPEAVREARDFAERALWGFDSLDIGPRDYNVFNVCDRLRTAAALLEEAQRVSEVASRYPDLPAQHPEASPAERFERLAALSQGPGEEG